MKGMMQFGKKGKLIPRFIGTFEILVRVGEVAYRFALPPIFVRVHLIFYVFMLWKYHKDRSNVLDFSTVHLDENLIYDEESVAILNRQVRKLRSKDIPYVKVCLRGQPTEEAT
ncbi:uncharacterized protein [Nicotiana tomentosiformis]|uniref:uncharacterized protein n=1 Tax=Nicotiana tomentosiformis TaxID=4098 RepID=UPI00388C64E1